MFGISCNSHFKRREAGLGCADFVLRFLCEGVKSKGLALKGGFIAVNAKKKRMLIVDDQRMVSDALKMVLTLDGYEVQTAESGREALKMFEIGKFDLIFTDFEMPEMNGHELA